MTVAAISVGSATDVPEGEARRFKAGDLEVCVVNLGGSGWRAVAAECSHQHAWLDEGDVDVDDETIECPLHGSVFDLNTGTPRSLPATRPIGAYGVRVDDGEILIEAKGDDDE